MKSDHSKLDPQASKIVDANSSESTRAQDADSKNGHDPIDPAEEWRVFLNNSSSLSGSWGRNQENYAKLCHSAVDEASKMLSAKPVSIKSFYEFLAGKRHDIAVDLHQPSNQKIGIMRPFDVEGDYQTSISPDGKYSDFFDDVKQRVIGLYNAEPASRKNYYIQIDKYKGNFRQGDWVVIDDGDLKLTGITFPKEDERDIMMCGGSFFFLHTEAKYIPKIYEKLDKLFSSVLSDPQPTLDNMKKIGEMVWYLAHAMPCKRGSAATTEMFARSMMKQIGLPAVPYEHHIPIDFEALIEPDKEKFINRFTTEFYPKINKYYIAPVQKEQSYYSEGLKKIYASSSVFFGGVSKVFGAAVSRLNEIKNNSTKNTK